MSENKVKAYDESYMDELEITTADDLYKNENEGFVFISYCSKNKETVFRDVVIPMQKKYGLRVYADKAFDYKNDEWVNQMQENLAASQAVLIFVSNEYVCSYACFLEVLTAVQEDIPILPIYIDNNPKAGDREKDLRISNNTRGAFEDIAKQLDINLELEKKGGSPSKETLNAMAGYLKLKKSIQNNKLNEKLLSQRFADMLKELTSIKHSINNSYDSLVSCINDTIKKNSKNCPVFSELSVNENKTKDSKAVKATDMVSVKTAVTKKPIQEKEETPTYVKTDIIEKAESADAVKKGNEVYSICGKEFTGNQSKMMTDVMKYIIENHFDMLDILEQKLTSVSKKAISELKKAGVNYFNTGSEFTYQGQIYSVGTSYDRSAKMSQIRNAIMITGENPSDFVVDGLFNEKQLEKAMLCYNNVNNSDSSENVAAIARKQGDEVYRIGNQEFTGNQSQVMTNAMKKQFEMARLRYNNANNPDSSENVASIARKQGDEVYRIGNQEFTGNQSKMMTDAMKYIIEKHFDMLDILEQKLTSVSKKPISELKKAGVNYFNSGSEFTYQGQIYSVGTSYGRNEKLAQIRNAIMLTAEEPQKFDINGLFNEKQFEEAEMRYYELFSEMAEE